MGRLNPYPIIMRKKKEKKAMQTIKQIKKDLKECKSFKDIDILIQDYIKEDKPKDKEKTYNKYKDIIYKILKEK